MRNRPFLLASALGALTFCFALLLARTGRSDAASLASLLNKPVLITNAAATKRFLLSTGAPPAGSEGGWGKSPAVVGADANYYDRGVWKITPSGQSYTIVNVTTKRLLLSSGEPKGTEVPAVNGWKGTPTVGADANYYNRALWNIVPSGNNFTFENVATHRLLFAAGEAVAAPEGGWTQSPAVIGGDANYYNRAVWTITPR